MKLKTKQLMINTLKTNYKYKVMTIISFQQLKL